jgi:DNA-binding MarR family transcriptional regulator
MDLQAIPTAPQPAMPSDAAGPSARACAAEVLEIMPAVMDAMRAAMRHQVGDQLSVPQFRCLNYIARWPGCSVSAVAAFLGVTLPTASAMVDRLVRAGAVAPRVAQADRRRSELHVTTAGLAQMRQIEAGALSELSQALACCSADEMQALQQSMAVLRRAFRPLPHGSQP